jgi:multidrug efflux pump subunit AcrA (membrane-fusion protein)
VGDRITRSTPLTTIEDNSGLELYLNIPVQEATRLKLGLPVKFLDATGAEIVTERINFISPSVDEHHADGAGEDAGAHPRGRIPLRSVRARQGDLVLVARAHRAGRAPCRASAVSSLPSSPNRVTVAS